MSTLREFTLDQGESEVFEVDTSEGAVLEVIVDPGDDRGAGSANPPIGSYDLDIRDEDGNSIGSSPVSSGFDDELTWVTSDIEGLMDVELTNTGSRGTVSLEISVLTGKEAVKAIQTGISIDLNQGRSMRLAEFSFLDGKILVDDGRVYDNLDDAEQAANSWALVGPGLFETNRFIVSDDDFLLAGFGKSSHIRRESGGTGSPVVIDGADRVTVRDLRVSVPSGEGTNNVPINSDNAPAEGIIERCFISEADDRGIDITSGASDWIIRNCLLSGTIEGAPIIVRGDNILVSENIIRGVAGTTGIGIRLNGAGCRAIDNDVSDVDFYVDVVAADCRVSGNRFENSQTGGVSLQAQNAVVGENTIIGAAGDGVSAFAGADGAVISNNLIRDSADDGIFLNAPDCLAEGNRVLNLGDDGVHISEINCSVISNMIRDATDFGVISFEPDSVVALNQVLFAGLDGIDFNANRPIAVLNMIRGPGDDAIDCDGNAAVIVGNIMRGIGGTRGIWSTGDRHTIGRNQILGPDTGVDVDGADSLISDNMFNNVTTDVDTGNATNPTVVDNVTT